MTYKAPVRDLAFALEETAEFGRLAAAFPHTDSETVTAVPKTSRGCSQRRSNAAHGSPSQASSRGARSSQASST